jgi:hypothetical protein
METLISIFSILVLIMVGGQVLHHHMIEYQFHVVGISWYGRLPTWIHNKEFRYVQVRELKQQVHQIGRTTP